MIVPVGGSGVTGGVIPRAYAVRQMRSRHCDGLLPPVPALDGLTSEDRIGGGDGTSGVGGGGGTRGACGFAHGGIGVADGDAFDAVER